MELAEEQRALVSECEALLSFADRDGIVCIAPVRGEFSASDRLLGILKASYGDDWTDDTLSALLRNTDAAGRTLESWLRDKFFIQHCKLFGDRPFIWHVWDGLPDGFSALVNYHKLDYKKLETLIYSYLGDWIQRQKLMWQATWRGQGSGWQPHKPSHRDWNSFWKVRIPMIFLSGGRA
jgi:hypothetical protein